MSTVNSSIYYLLILSEIKILYYSLFYAFSPIPKVSREECSHLTPYLYFTQCRVVYYLYPLVMNTGAAITAITLRMCNLPGPRSAPSHSSLV